MALADLQGRWFRINQCLADIVGYPMDELLALSFRDITNPEDLGPDVEQLARLVAGEIDRFELEKRYIRKDGGIVWVDLNVSLARTETGEPDYVIAVIEDIADRKSAEERLRQSEERYRGLFQNSNEGLMVYRVVRGPGAEVEDLIIEDVNPAAEQRTGVPREDLIGRHMTEVYASPEVMRGYVDVVRRTLEQGRSGQFEVDFAPLDRTYLASVFPLGGDLYAAAATDVTELRRAQEALQRQSEAIRQAYVDVIDAVTGGKLVLITADELDAELGEPLMSEEPITEASELAEARRRVRAALGPHYPRLAESTEFLTAMGEALNNALKHAGGGSYRAFGDDECAQLCVSDSGPGIDFHTLPKAALVPGFSTTNTLGLGFTIMPQVCDRVMLYTMAGEGTTIVLELAESRA